MRNFRFLLAPVAAAVLAACAAGPNYKPPETKSAEKFDGVEATYSTEEGAAEFWQTFEDKTLDHLVDMALMANYDVRIALSRVAEARALRRDTAFDLAPSINAGGGYTKTKFSEAQTLAGAPRDSELYDAGFDAFWELDFFGRVRRGLEASTAQAEALEAAERDTQVIVTAEVTRTYFELRGFQQQLDVARRNVTNQKSTLDLATARLEAGRGTEFDTARAQAQLSATLGTISPLEAAVARSIHRLSVLVGREPGALRAELASTRDLPPLPGIVPVGDPAGLLRRRPDIASPSATWPAPPPRSGWPWRICSRVSPSPATWATSPPPAASSAIRDEQLLGRARHFLGHLRPRPRAGTYRRVQGAQGHLPCCAMKRPC
jgi:multidrug efflux system outer membrane protein